MHIRDFCLALAFGVLTLWNAGCAASDSSSDSADTSGSGALTGSASRCLKSEELSEQSIRYAQSGAYAKGYAVAQRALSAFDSCGDGDSPFNYDQDEAAAAGMALGARGVNERHLPQGNSATDLHLAKVFFTRCVNLSDSDQLSDACRGAERSIAELDR